MPLLVIIVLVTVLYLVLGRGRFKLPWLNDSDRPASRFQNLETPLDILKKRYARGELTREEFEQMKQDIQGG
ncbi:SHOCT domain-containing protein [Noviherbaspirillum pedocola]